MLDESGEASPFVAFVLEQVCGLDASTGAWTRGSHVAPAWGRRAVTGETVKPRHLWQGAAVAGGCRCSWTTASNSASARAAAP